MVEQSMRLFFAGADAAEQTACKGLAEFEGSYTAVDMALELISEKQFPGESIFAVASRLSTSNVAANESVSLLATLSAIVLSSDSTAENKVRLLNDFFLGILGQCDDGRVALPDLQAQITEALPMAQVDIELNKYGRRITRAY